MGGKSNLLVDCNFLDVPEKLRHRNDERYETATNYNKEHTADVRNSQIVMGLIVIASCSEKKRRQVEVKSCPHSLTHVLHFPVLIFQVVQRARFGKLQNLLAECFPVWRILMGREKLV